MELLFIASWTCAEGSVIVVVFVCFPINVSVCVVCFVYDCVGECVCYLRSLYYL